MRSPDNFTFFSLVLLTLCTTKPVTPSASHGTESSTVSRAATQIHHHVQQRTVEPPVVVRRTS